MSYENVTIWFAKNTDGEIITINEINEDNKRNHFLCPVCGSDVIPRAIKSKHLTQHFAHLDKNKCNNETMIHWWYKNRFLEKGDKFTVVSDKERDYVVSEVIVEQEYETSEKVYKPDVTIISECGERIFFEMKYSNGKEVKDYIDIWLELKDVVVEIDIKQLMLQEKVPKFKALFYDGKCFNTKRNDTYYNTIGRYKEKLSVQNNKIQSDYINRIKNLDWFWKDILLFKKNLINMNELFQILELIDNKDQEITKSILRKQKCSNIYEEYIKHKVKVSVEQYADYLMSTGIDFLLSYDLIEKYNKINDVIIKIQYNGKYKDDYPFKYFGSREIKLLKSTNESQYKTIDNFIEYIQENEYVRDKFEHAYSNQTFMKVIKDIKSQYKDYDKRYFIKLSNCPFEELRVDMEFGYNNSLTLTIPDEIIFSSDYYLTYSFFQNSIKDFFTNKKHISKENVVISVLKNLSKKFDNYLLSIETIPKTYGIWITYKKYSREIDFEYYFDETDRILIELSVGFNDYRIEISSSDIQIIDTSLTEEVIKCVNLQTPKDYLKIENIISDIIYNSIQSYMKNFKCKDCKTQLKITNQEIIFFMNKGFELPKRCKSCRNKRKQTKLQESEVIN